MTLSGFRAFIDKQNWIFAKTYANKAPHEYCLLEKIPENDRSEFVNAVHFILAEGIECYWYKNKRRYLFLDGKMYWIMSQTAEEATLINRCNVADYDIKMQIYWNGGRS